jgi:glycosyltransferase involved in cell wall biosynthesis
MRLALVMIVRDEARGIARALESARGGVDAMIVLDTGSSDGTPEIAEGLGASVGRFAWCDDFSAARNAALDMSDADWNLILDGDEWLAGDLSALSPEALPALGEAFLGHLPVASQTRVGEAIEWSQAWIPRLLPRGVRYAGKVHEQPVSDLPARPIPVEILHDGYLAEQLARKAGRNEALLIAELNAAPEDAYLWFQLGKEYQVREAPPQAAHCFAEALRLAPADVAYRHALVVRALTAFKTAEQFDQALALADAEFEAWQESPDFFFALGDLYLEGAARNPDVAVSDFLPMVEFAWKRCLEIGERSDLDGSVRGRGGHLAAHNLSVFYGSLGRAESAAEYAALAERLRRGA